MLKNMKTDTLAKLARQWSITVRTLELCYDHASDPHTQERIHDLLTVARDKLTSIDLVLATRREKEVSTTIKHHTKSL